MDVGLHGRARIAAAVSAATLPPQTRSTGRSACNLAGEPGRGGDRAGRLDGELRPLVEEPERVLDLLLGHEHALEIAADLQRQPTGEGRAEAVGDRARLDRDRLAALERRRGARGTAPARRRSPASGRRSRLDPGDEPAAADSDDDGVGVGRVLLDLESNRAGAGEHERVVERMDERRGRSPRSARADARTPPPARPPRGRRTRRSRGWRRSSAPTRPATSRPARRFPPRQQPTRPPARGCRR